MPVAIREMRNGQRVGLCVGMSALGKQTLCLGVSDGQFGESESGVCGRALCVDCFKCVHVCITGGGVQVTSTFRHHPAIAREL